MRSAAAPRPALFLDRDGTLVEDVGTIRSPDQLRLYADTVDALRSLGGRYLLFVITNQPGIAKGLVSLEEVRAVNAALDATLRREGVDILEWFVCPHARTEGCGCIKPKPEFVLRARDSYGLDLRRSFVIGDHPHDALTAKELGVHGLYLLTGHGGRHIAELPIEVPVFHRISDAADWIRAHPDPEADVGRSIEAAAEAIRAGGVAAFPTETVYGLGADIFKPEALESIFRIKGRPLNNPLIAHISSLDELDRLASSVPDTALRLAETFWPGPLTLVLPKRPEVPGLATGGLDSVAVRMPAHPIARELIRRCGSPLAAPSANRFTCASPTTGRHVREQLGDACGIVIDGGACRVGLESTVLSLTGDVPLLLRPGGVTLDELAGAIGEVRVAAEPQEGQARAESPGMMRHHYAPATKLSAFSSIPDSYAGRSDVGFLLFAPPKASYAGPTEVLSGTGDPREAAANFFAALRRLDALGLREIVAEYAPDAGLGRAINNRLSKAAMGRLPSPTPTTIKEISDGR
jgi:L-threonylcarbamoyladenylate synthase